MKMKLPARIFRAIAVALIWLVVFFPFYWILISSFKTEKEMLSANATFLPHTFTLNHYYRVLFESSYARYLGNSMFVALATTVIGLLLAICSAYSLSDFTYKGKRFSETLILYASMFPGVLLLLPVYVLVNKLGLLNSLWALVIVYVMLYVPFGVFNLRTFFTSIHKELREAAWIDGATKMQVLFRVILPLSAPGLVTVASWTFILSWSEYLFGMLLINNPAKKTVVVGLADWMGEYYLDWGALSAGSVLVVLPIIILFAFMGKGFIKGLTSGGVKG